MAGFGREPDVQLRPELSTNRTPVDFGVEQNAVAHLADAFRQGLVNADDIISRYGTLAKTKERAQIQGLDEFISPEAIQGRQNQLKAANTEAVLKSSPEYVATQEAVLRDTLNKANSGDYDSMRQAMITKGWAVPDFDPKTGWNDATRKDTSKAFNEFVNYHDSVSSAKAELDSIKPITVKEKTETVENGQSKTVTKDIIKYVDSSGVEVDAKEYQKIRKFAAMTPSMWRHMGRPQFVELSGIKPGKFGGGVSGPLSEPEVTPKAAGAAAPLPTVTTETQSPGIVTSIETKPVDKSTVKGPTEAQQRAELALARFASANDVFNTMKAQGYDPTSVTSYVNSFLPEILKSGDRKTYESAMDAWSQGLLRLESGAAIARQEKSWYERSFFPQINDPPSLVENKARMRADIERMVAEIAQAGGVNSPESKAQADRIAAEAKKIYEQAGANLGGTERFRPGAAPTGKVTTTSTGKKLIFDGQNYRYVQ